MGDEAARRVVTGVGPDGRSTVLADGAASTVLRFPDRPDPTGNWSVVNWLWSTEVTPDVPLTDAFDDGMPGDWFPGPGGTRFIFETLGPFFGVEQAPPEEVESGATAMGDAGTSFNARYADGIGAHSSDTVDYAVIVSGKLWMEMTDGTEVVLGPGDCVVQTGVRHTWRNRQAEPARVAFIIIGANRTADPEALESGSTRA